MIPRSCRRKIESKKERETEGKKTEREGLRDAHIYKSASIIASRSPPFDRSLSMDASVFPGGLLVSLSLSCLYKIYALVFPKIQNRGPSVRGAPRVGTCVLCSFDHAGRIDACVFPAHPSLNYLGREPSSLPRSFPSLLAIRGGAPWIEGESRANRARISRLRNIYVCMYAITFSLSFSLSLSLCNGMIRRGLRCASGTCLLKRGKRER